MAKKLKDSFLFSFLDRIAVRFFLQRRKKTFVKTWNAKKILWLTHSMRIFYFFPYKKVDFVIIVKHQQQYEAQKFRTIRKNRAETFYRFLTQPQASVNMWLSEKKFLLNFKWLAMSVKLSSGNFLCCYTFILCANITLSLSLFKLVLSSLNLF